jgi:hypothetical protein
VESGLFEETEVLHAAFFAKRRQFYIPSIFWTPLLEQVQANCHDFQAALGWAYKYKQVEMSHYLTNTLITYWKMCSFI